MSALLATLRSAARPRHAWPTAGGVAALALVGVVVGQPAGNDPCSAARLADAWTDDRARIDTAFDESDLPHARQSWATNRAELDAYVEAWSLALLRVCHGVDRPEPGDPRLRCLRERQRRFEALTRVLQRPGADALTELGPALARLELPGHCLQRDHLEREDAVEDPRHATIDALVAEAEALAQTPWLDEARTTAHTALEQAHAAGYEALEARASLALGIVELADDDQDAARPHLEHAYFVADAGGDHQTAAIAASKVVFALAVGTGSDADAVRWAEHARVHLDRMDGAGPIAVVELSLGLMWHKRGAYDEAARYAMRAAEEFAKTSGAEHPSVATALSNAGYAYISAGEIDQGLEVLHRAAALYEHAYGWWSPRRAASMLNIGLGMYRSGRYSEALAQFDETLEIIGALPRGERRLMAQAMINRALCLTALGRHDEALATLLEARELLLVTIGTEHPLLASVDMNIGLIHFGAGRPEQALQAYERASATQVAVLGAVHPETALTEHNIGVTLNGIGRHADAEPHLRRSSVAFETSLGADADYTALSKMELARALDGTGRYDDALAFVDTATRVLESKGDQHQRFVVMSLMYRGRTLRKLERWAESQAALDLAARRNRTLPDPDAVLATELFLERGRLAAARGHGADARAELEDARRMARSSESARGFVAEIEAELRGL